MNYDVAGLQSSLNATIVQDVDSSDRRFMELEFRDPSHSYSLWIFSSENRCSLICKCLMGRNGRPLFEFSLPCNDVALHTTHNSCNDSFVIQFDSVVGEKRVRKLDIIRHRDGGTTVNGYS